MYFYSTLVQDRSTSMEENILQKTHSTDILPIVKLNYCEHLFEMSLWALWVFFFFFKIKNISAHHVYLDTAAHLHVLCILNMDYDRMVTEFWQYENYNTEKKILITFILNTFNCIKIDTIYTLSYGSETVILEHLIL